MPYRSFQSVLYLPKIALALKWSHAHLKVTYEVTFSWIQGTLIGCDCNVVGAENVLGQPCDSPEMGLDIAMSKDRPQFRCSLCRSAVWRLGMVASRPSTTRSIMNVKNFLVTCAKEIKPQVTINAVCVTKTTGNQKRQNL